MSKVFAFTGASIIIVIAGSSLLQPQTILPAREQNQIIEKLRNGRWREVPVCSSDGSFDYVVSSYRQGLPKQVYTVTVTRISVRRMNGQDLYCLSEIQSAVKNSMGYFLYNDSNPSAEIPFPISGTSSKFVSNGRMKIVFERRSDGKIGLQSIWIGYRG